MKQNIEFTQSGLKCDNINCDWKDTSIVVSDYPLWINRPCPKCGDNVLTLQDYENVKKVFAVVDYVNSLSKEQIESYTGKVSSDEIRKVKIDSHKTIKIVEDNNI